MSSPSILSFLECVSKSPDNRTDTEFILIYEYIKKLETLNTFKDSTLHSLAHSIKLKHYQRDNLIFQKGELITSWFILFSGSVKIGDQVLKPINKFGRKTHFQNFRSIDSIALQDSLLLIIDYHGVEKLSEENTLPSSISNISVKSDIENINDSQDNTDIIVLTDDSSSCQSKDIENPFNQDAEIICLTDDDDDDENCNLNASNQNDDPEEDSECIELYSIHKKFPLEKENFDFDDQEVLERWRVKKRANPSVNLSMTNYGLRAFGKIRRAPERKFKPNIFFDESLDETDLSDEEKYKIDLEALEQKINSLSSRFSILIDNYDALFKISLETLDQKYKKNTEDIMHHFCLEKDKLIKNNDIWYQNELNKLNFDRNKLLNQAKSKKNKAEKALRDLFDSGCYVRGKFSEYVILETRQPKARRRAYFDDGKRYMLLPKNQIKNILIEDIIYEYYYGKP